MAVFSKSPDAARTAVNKAQSTVDEWNAKAAAARAEAQQLDADAGAQILEDESAAERITLQVQTLERKARAYDQAAAEAGRKLDGARQDAMNAAIRSEEDAAAKARKAVEAHESKVLALKAKLEELDGCEWERGRMRDSVTGEYGRTLDGKADADRHQADRHEIRAAMIRYYIATGKTPGSFYDLNAVTGTEFSSFAMPMLYEFSDIVPECVTEAKAAGLTFEA